MYNVAQVIDEKCVVKGMPPVHHVLSRGQLSGSQFNQDGGKVMIDRCKGCELCVVVCDAAKHNAISMQAVSATGQLIAHKGESAAIGQAYQG